MCFQFGPVANRAAVNIHEQVFGRPPDTFSVLGDERPGVQVVAGLDGRCARGFSGTCQACFPGCLQHVTLLPTLHWLLVLSLPRCGAWRYSDRRDISL